MQVTSKLEVWGGIEGTINRVVDTFHDQCARNGHRDRAGDLRQFAQIGIRRLRYPFLWETIAPDHENQLTDEARWKWVETKMAELTDCGIKPIAGLLHHGSGPHYTSLLDPQFPEKFARYAAEFARRYPEVEDYTPVNEPLTTARFSGLYGVWYPHKKDNASFLRALLYQLQGVKLAMQEIRKVNPRARLIQTDDMGKATATTEIQYQADFENERRWLSFDLLCGKVTREHRLYSFLLKNGLTENELLEFEQDPCPPDLIGINHYPLSNRYLDHRTELYPLEFRGGNEKDQYADLGAVDVPQITPPTPELILLETWKRYGIPIAVTEVHVRGTRETQLRWFHKIWSAALSARDQGADVRAVTAWAMLGSYNWDSLCTRETGHYESGVFDVSAKSPRPTALARFIHSLTEDELAHLHKHEHLYSRPILITGGNGTLGRAFARICKERGLNAETVIRATMDIADESQVRAALRSIKPWAVINTAGYVRVDQAELEPEKCFRENVVGPEILARVCAEQNLAFLTFSSDMVFDGESDSAYVESSPVNPCNVYGHTKAEAEKRVLKAHPRALIVRTSSFFGPWDTSNFVFILLDHLRSKRPFAVSHELKMSATYVPDLVNSCLDLLIDGETGIAHLTNDGAMSWAELALEATRNAAESQHFRDLQLDPGLIVTTPLSDLGYVAKRPRFSALASERFKAGSTVTHALNRYFKDLKLPIGAKP